MGDVKISILDISLYYILFYSAKYVTRSFECCANASLMGNYLHCSYLFPLELYVRDKSIADRSNKTIDDSLAACLSYSEAMNRPVRKYSMIVTSTTYCNCERFSDVISFTCTF